MTFFQALIQIILDTMFPIAILMIATTGIVLIFKTSYTTNFAQGSIATLSAYFVDVVILFLTSRIPGISVPVQLVLGIASGMIFAFLCGWFIDTRIIRKSRYISAVGKQMITMGIVLIITGLIPVIFGNLTRSLPRIPGENIRFTLFNYGYSMVYHQFVTILIAILVLSLVFFMLRFTKWGLGVRATASNETVAGMMGINTRLITALSWSIAGGLGALAASLYSPFASGSELSVGMMGSVQVNAFLASVLGGFSTFGGPLLGAFLIPLFTGIITFIESTWTSVIVNVLILLVVLWKPIGLLGKKVIKKV
jgi:branched-chain amino acid transport system permease protein